VTFISWTCFALVTTSLISLFLYLAVRVGNMTTQRRDAPKRTRFLLQVARLLFGLSILLAIVCIIPAAFSLRLALLESNLYSTYIPFFVLSLCGVISFAVGSILARCLFFRLKSVAYNLS
jgi:hypothetical protein